MLKIFVLFMLVTSCLCAHDWAIGQVYNGIDVDTNEQIDKDELAHFFAGFDDFDHTTRSLTKLDFVHIWSQRYGDPAVTAEVIFAQYDQTKNDLIDDLDYTAIIRKMDPANTSFATHAQFTEFMMEIYDYIDQHPIG